jgi:predicted nucleic acid-binding protein
MSVDAFLDTNVLVYAAAGAGQDRRKQQTALSLIESIDFGISAQVLQEFFVTTTRKLQVRLSPDDALAWIENLEVFPCLPVDAALVKIAIETCVRYQLSYWDAAILAAAQGLHARVLYSEDLSHGQRYGDVEVINPFLG